MVRDEQQKYLAVSGEGSKKFEGTVLNDSLRMCPLNGRNAARIREIFPELKPVPASQKISFGFGDRLGLATPGHIKSLGARPVFPVFAQQSVRENARTKRTPRDVVDDASWGCLQAGYIGPFGADADHLKEISQLKEAVSAGYSMFTIDLSDYIKNPAEMPPEEEARCLALIPNINEVEDFFQEKEYTIAGKSYRFSLPEIRRLIVTFVPGLRFAIECCQILEASLPAFDFEVSVDETKQTTTPLAHIFVVEYLRRNKVPFTSLAPKFPGEFEKAIDYKGDLAEFEEIFRRHTEICRFFGGYKMSIHSGSDKFAVYPIIRKISDAFHVKTAGTSWLQAVKTLALRTPSFYRRIHQCALNNISQDRIGYSVNLDINKIPPLDSIEDGGLTTLFSLPDCRQLLHITYGSVLAQFRSEMFGSLQRYEEDHYRLITEHLNKHLDLLLPGCHSE
ncbi:MAG: tagaturonate epimerase family protein [Candidatus Omnitrophota bacterium]